MRSTLIKKVGAPFLAIATAVTIAGAPTLQAFAADSSSAGFRSPNTYTSGSYTFDKLSHPDKAVGTADGIVDYMGNDEVEVNGNGQGDRGQSYAWSAVSYGDWVYVGTCYGAMGQTLSFMDSALGDNFDEETMRATLNAMFNGTFYYGEEDGGNPGGILVKVNVKTGETKLLLSKKKNYKSCAFRNAIAFNGKLYFCGGVSEYDPTTWKAKAALPSIYEVDPETDEVKCVYTGFTIQEYGQAYQQHISTGIRGMTVFNNQLIVSCVGLEGPYILATSTPSDSSSFKKIATADDLFNYAAYRYEDSIYGGSIWEIVPYNGSIYVALCTGRPENKPDEHTMQSFAIVRGDQAADGSWKWTSVVGDQEKDGAKYPFGIDPERTRAGACNMVVYNGYLYIGEYEDIEIALEDLMFKTDVQFLAKNLEQSVSLYRMDKNENMELVVGDKTTMFPNGGSSGMGSGFTNHTNQYIWQSKVYKGKLYLGTFDSASLLQPIGQFTNGDILKMSKDEWKSQLNYLKVLIELMSKKDDSENGAQLASAEEASLATVAETSAVAPAAEGDLSAQAEEVPTEEAPTEEELATELVQKAIADANIRYNGTVSGPAAYAALTENGASETVALTGEQVSDMVNGILNGTILPDSLADSVSDQLVSYSKELSTLTDGIDETGSQEFVDAYVSVCKQAEELTGLLPDSVKQLLDKLVGALTKDNMVAFGKILKYLSTAERGFDMYVTSDGINFQAVTTNGFGDPYNHGLRAFATGDDWMVIGTANPFYGTQLWELREEHATVTPGESSNPTDITNPVLPENTEKKAGGVGTEDANTFLPWIALLLVAGTGVALILRKRTESSEFI